MGDKWRFKTKQLVLNGEIATARSRPAKKKESLNKGPLKFLLRQVRISGKQGAFATNT